MIPDYSWQSCEMLTVILAECDVSDDCEYAVGGRVGDCEARDGTGEEEREGAF